MAYTKEQKQVLYAAVKAYYDFSKAESASDFKEIMDLISAKKSSDEDINQAMHRFYAYASSEPFKDVTQFQTSLDAAKAILPELAAPEPEDQNESPDNTEDQSQLMGAARQAEAELRAQMKRKPAERPVVREEEQEADVVAGSKKQDKPEQVLMFEASAISKEPTDTPFPWREILALTAGALGIVYCIIEVAAPLPLLVTFALATNAIWPFVLLAGIAILSVVGVIYGAATLLSMASTSEPKGDKSMPEVLPRVINPRISESMPGEGSDATPANGSRPLIAQDADDDGAKNSLQ